VANPYGEIVAKARADREEILVADFDFAEIEDFRRIWPFFRDRRPETYAGLARLAH